jgi:soluble lytic murein transglycosylase
MTYSTSKRTFISPLRPKSLVLVLLIILLGASGCGIQNNIPFLASSTPTPTLTPTPTATPPPTSTPLPTPTPILSPTESELPGDQAYFYGDWGKALTSYQATLDTSSSPTEQSAALLGMGKVYYQLGDYPNALEYLRGMITSYPDSPYLAEAQYNLGLTYNALERYLEAAAAYEAYLELQPGVIDAYIQEKRGDALVASGNQVAAINAYQAALAADQAQKDFDIQLKIGRAYAEIQDYETALVIYQDIYNTTTNDYIKANVDYRMGQIYQQLERPEQAQTVYLDAVENYPLSYDSYLALVELVNQGVPVSELDRGLVDYFAGKYSLAIDAFNRYLADPDAGEPATALYYKGFALRATGELESALQAWDEIIENHPEDSYWDEAWEFKAYTQWAYMNRYAAAVETLEGFAAQRPFHPRAAEFLFDAARVQERIQKYPEAIMLWEQILTDYPGTDYAILSLFRIGITHYRLEDHSSALETFTRYVGITDTTERLAQAYLWMGKVHQALGEDVAAASAWQKAANTDPTGYYSERARDMLQNRAPFDFTAEYDLAYNPEEERQEAENWMRATFAIPPATNLKGLGLLAEDPRLIRGTELWNLDLYEEARLEFEALRTDISYDPVSSYRLANYLTELGLYRSAVFAARQVLNAAGMDDAGTLNAPFYFNTIRFGTYYLDLVLPAAQNYDFHPLLILSVIRQESLFEGFVRSSAGARGLMQIIPSTGADIAQKAGWPPDYTAADLYRPIVSVNLGVAYLESQRRYFDGDLYPALAAYNAGAGNAARWQTNTRGDPDLFLESVTFSETRQYLQGIKEIFTIYRQLYERPQ